MACQLDLSSYLPSQLGNFIQGTTRTTVFGSSAVREETQTTKIQGQKKLILYVQYIKNSEERKEHEMKVEIESGLGGWVGFS